MKTYVLKLKGHELALMKDALQVFMEAEVEESEISEVVSVLIDNICTGIIKKIDETGYMRYDE